MKTHIERDMKYWRPEQIKKRKKYYFLINIDSNKKASFQYLATLNVGGFLPICFNFFTCSFVNELVFHRLNTRQYLELFGIILIHFPCVNRPY